jgi:DNA-binding transcriptional ArsR family regulator
VVTVLGNIARWQILAELSLGEPRMVSELADIAGCSPGMASRHMTTLAKAGLVVKSRGLYQIPKQYLPNPGERVIDLGHCLLRLVATETPAS